ncbi:MAG: hypothetical protein ABIJ45_14455, partial [Candidatus Zixiibacteriota bacterium]
MKFSNRKVGLLIALMVFALTGLIILQVSLFDSAMQLKEATFKNNIASILKNIAERIEMEQVFISAFQTICDTSQELEIVANLSDNSNNDTLHSRIVVITVDSMQSPNDKFNDSCLNNASTNIYWESLGAENKFCFPDLPGDSQLNNTVYYKNLSDTSKIFMKLKMATDSGRVKFVNKVLDRMWILDSTPIENRLDSAMIDSLIKNGLMDNNIDIDYVFGVRLEEPGIELIGNTDIFNNQLFNSEFKTRLFPYDVLGPQVNLYLYFPFAGRFLWSAMTPLLILMIGFIAIIIFSFVYTIMKIIQQKKNANTMVSF